MIVYASLASLSVAAMFLGGIVPGILIGLGLMVYNYFYARSRGYEGEARASLKELAMATIYAFPALVMPGIILGGIISGVFTATEAGAVAAVYAALVGFFVYRELKPSHLERVFVRATATGSMVMLIVAASTAFGWILTIEDAPSLVVGALLQVSDNPTVVLGLIMVMLVVVGFFIDVLPAAIILVPVLTPVATQFNYDPIHFAVLVVVTLTIGLVTPPVGVVLYVTTALAGTTLAKAGRMAIIPAAIMFIVCILAVIFPAIITGIPNYFLPAAYLK
jgi:C4-dicarboxylate transporter, DctM subunit